jgi:hypothetical protein
MAFRAKSGQVLAGGFRPRQKRHNRASFRWAAATRSGGNCVQAQLFDGICQGRRGICLGEYLNSNTAGRSRRSGRRGQLDFHLSPVPRVKARQSLPQAKSTRPRPANPPSNCFWRRVPLRQSARVTLDDLFPLAVSPGDRGSDGTHCGSGWLGTTGYNPLYPGTNRFPFRSPFQTWLGRFNPYSHRRQATSK